MILILFILSLTITFSDGKEKIKYTKISELSSVAPGLENQVDTNFQNLELFVEWSNWSCCSACCCPKAVCKQFETSGDKCKTVKSIQHRRGELMIRRKGATENGDLEKLLMNRDTAKFSEAISISSITDDLEKSRIALTKKLKVPPETLEVFQAKDCAQHSQKLDCWELAKCLYNSTEMLPEKEVTNVEERDVCENASILVLRDAYNILSLMPEQLYRLQIDRKIGDGNIVDANFTYNGKPVEKLKRVKDCEHQPKRIFQHPNSEDLIVRLSEAELAENPKIIAVISYQSPSQIEIAVDLVLKTKQKRP